MRMKIYNILTAVLAVLAAPFFLMSKRGRFNLKQRFGLWKIRQDKYLWLHGASLGEISGLGSFVRLLRKQNPNIKILVTTTSPTGYKRGLDLSDNVKLLPFDSALYYNMAIGRCEISSLIISETELWPGLYSFAYSRDIPVKIINGRISDYTVDRYKLIRWLLKPLLSRVSKALIVDQKCVERFEDLGVPSEKIANVPNTKYDKASALINKPCYFRENYLKNKRPTFTLGCIRPGEEEIWFPAIHQALKNLDLNIIVAPRHKEKFKHFAGAMFKYQIDFISWSQNYQDPLPKGHMFFLDTYGKLEEAYAVSDAAFIGATIVDIGGHNPLEAAAHGCFIYVGQFVSTIEDIIDRLKDDGACATVTNIDQAYGALKFIAENKELANQRGKAGVRLYEEYQGVTQIALRELGYAANS